MKVYRIQNNKYREVEATKLTNNRVYFLNGRNEETWEKKSSGHYGYLYVMDEISAIERIISSLKIQIENKKASIENMNTILNAMNKKLDKIKTDE